jgi:hypothetical protein
MDRKITNLAARVQQRTLVLAILRISALTQREWGSVNDRIDQFGNNRAELRWDENGIRYRIVLSKEGEEWRVDDIHIPARSQGGGRQGRQPAPRRLLIASLGQRRSRWSIV